MNPKAIKPDKDEVATEWPRSANGRPVAPNWFRLGYLIHDVSRMRRTLFDQHMKPEGITRSQWWLLANLSRHPDNGMGVITTELTRLMDVGKVTLGGLIERLEVAGYVYRRPDKVDGRAKRVFITQAGYALIERMKVITQQLNQQLCAGLTSDGVRQTEEALTVIKDNIRVMLAEVDAGEPLSRNGPPPTATDRASLD